MEIKSELYKLYHMQLKALLPTRFYIRPMTKFLKEMKQKELVGAEVGVSRGFNALSMLQHLQIKKMYLIDTGFVKPLDQLLKYNVVFIEKPSVDAAKHIQSNSLDFVYIDANHEQEEVKKDINTWIIKVKPEGVIGGHDFNQQGVANAVSEFVDKDRLHIEGKDWWFIR